MRLKQMGFGFLFVGMFIFLPVEIGLLYADELNIIESGKVELRYWNPNWKIEQNGIDVFDETTSFYELKLKASSAEFFAGLGIMFGQVKSHLRSLGDDKTIVTVKEEGHRTSRFDLELYGGKTFVLDSPPIATGLGIGFRWFHFGDLYYNYEYDSIDIVNLFVHVPLYIKLYHTKSFQMGLAANANYSPLNYGSGFGESSTGGHFFSALGEISLRWTDVLIAAGYQYQLIQGLDEVGFEKDTLSGPYLTLAILFD